MRTSLTAVVLASLIASAWGVAVRTNAAPPPNPPAGDRTSSGPAARDPSTCAEAWREAKASGASQSQAAYVERCEKGQSDVAARTSFPGAAPGDLAAPAPPAPTASSIVPGPMPQGATALCKDGSYSTASRHVDACVGSGGVEQFFK